MDDLVKFEDRELLYKEAQVKHSLEFVYEKYYPEMFGNFYVVLAAENFFLRYGRDRISLSIDIASRIDPENWYYLSTVEVFLERNGVRVDELHRKYDPENPLKNQSDFLDAYFDTLSKMFNAENYPFTRPGLDDHLNKNREELLVFQNTSSNR